MAAAGVAWGLVLPMRLVAGGVSYAPQIAFDLVLAAVVGATAGHLAARAGRDVTG